MPNMLKKDQYPPYKEEVTGILNELITSNYTIIHRLNVSYEPNCKPA